MTWCGTNAGNGNGTGIRNIKTGIMKFGKWLGGGLGWALGGPLGAIIGFVIGSIADSGSEESRIGTDRRTYGGDFKFSLLVLIACIIKADGVRKPEEMGMVRRILAANFGEAGTDEAMQILNRILQQDVDESQVAMQIGRCMNYSSKLELLHLLFQIAYADGEVCEAELFHLRKMAGLFGISSADFEAVKAPYTRNSDSGWAYTALGIDSSATDEEIKKAYRRMAMKYHPDKLAGLGDDVKKAGAEKFRSVHEAYEFLKKERGMK